LIEWFVMSTAVASKGTVTPEDLLAMPDGRAYELIRGQLVERNIGLKSSWVGGRLLIRLGRFCEEHSLGWVFNAENGYQCFPHDPGLVRRPDVSFIRFGRLPAEVLPEGWAKIPPDLAVEVISPNDTAYELDEKLEDYREAAFPLVWVINPKSRTVRVHRRDGSVNYLHESDVLSGEDVIPGFQCPVRELFPSSAAPAQAPPSAKAPGGPQ
jgi:Uma2 family endonuclease